MQHFKTIVLRSLLFIIFSFLVLNATGAAAKVLRNQLPAEYDNMQGFLVAWLPMGPFPDGPITELSDEEIRSINKKSVSGEFSYGHKFNPRHNKVMDEKIKLKKGGGSPDTDGLDLDVYPYHYMMLDLVKAIVDSGSIAHVVTDSEYIRDKIIQFMIACGYEEHDFAKIEFHYYWLDSIWMRDYGPWIAKSNNFLSVINNEYYAGRPSDNIFPEFFALKYGLEKIDFDQVYSEGGNLLTDGINGRGFSTQGLLLGNPGLFPEDIISLFKNVLNLDEFILMPGEIADFDEALAALGGTFHVDMGLKLLSDTKVMIGDFAQGSPGKEFLDSWAEWIETHTNSKGEPYEVFRVTGSTDGFHPFSYLNSVIINKTVIVPQFGDPQGDAVAIEAYENALPNYKTIGVRSEILPPLSGGLHCITKEVPLGVLKETESQLAGPGADEDDIENHNDLVWVNDGIGDFNFYKTWPDVTVTAPAVMASTLGLSIGHDNSINFVIPSPDMSNQLYLNPWNNLYLKFPADILLNSKPPIDLVLRNYLLFPEEPKSAVEQLIYLNADISVVSIGTMDLAAFHGIGINTSSEAFCDAVDSLIEKLSALQEADPGKKIVLTTPFNFGAIKVGVAVAYGLEPSPADIEESEFANLYAQIMRQKVESANSQGLNIAIADYTDLHNQIATLTGIEIQGRLFSLSNLDLLIEPGTNYLTDLFGALHAYVVIESINLQYSTTLDLPDLGSY